MSVQHDDPDFLECFVHELLWLLEYRNHPADVPEDWLAKLDPKEFAELGCEVVLSVIEIGASMSQADLRAHRDVILDALVRSDCGLQWTGKEPRIVPSAGGALSEATRLWARDRRRDLERKSDGDIRDECRKVLCAHGTRDARLEDVLKQSAKEISRRMRGVAAKRHPYSPVFVEAGRQLRKSGIPPKRACERLKEAPIEVGEGLTVTADPENRRILVMRDGEQIDSMSQDHFRKEYMKNFFRHRSVTENVSIDRH